MRQDLECVETGLISFEFLGGLANEGRKNQFTRSYSVVWNLGNGPVFLAERIFYRTVQQQHGGTEPVRLQRLAEPNPDSRYNQPEHHEPELQLSGRVRFQLEPDRSTERHQPEFAQLDQSEFDFAEFKQPERQQHVAQQHVSARRQLWQHEPAAAGLLVSTFHRLIATGLHVSPVFLAHSKRSPRRHRDTEKKRAENLLCAHSLFNQSAIKDSKLFSPHL